MRRMRAFRALGAALVAMTVAWLSIRPSQDRDWAPDHARLARAAFDGSLVRIENVRRFDHCPEGGAPVERWETRALDLSALDSLWLVLSPFERDWRGPAHPFLSFGFGDTAFVSVSVEARRERSESYSIWKGMLKQYEMIYVVADERDPLELRVLCRDDDVYLYPLRASPEDVRALFREMMKKVNRLAERPEFYHTFFNNCAGTVLDHANAVATKHIPGGWRVLVPGYADEIVYDMGLVDAEGTLEEVRARFLANERIRAFAGAPDFSAAIRRPASSAGRGQ